MHLSIGADHAGYLLKNQIVEYLQEQFQVTDYGTYSSERCDYPIYTEKVAKAVLEGKADKGIVICGSGAGVATVANKLPTIRCTVSRNPQETIMARRHGDINVLALSGRLPLEEAKECIHCFLNTPFDQGRHSQRLEQIADIERRYHKPY